jgi:hypothetical protein
VPFLVRKSNDLVLERGTVARPDAADLSVEKRRPTEVRSHDLVHAVCCVQQVTIDLRPVNPRGQE